MFDLGAAAIIFSFALAFAPKGMPHHEIFVKTGLVSLGQQHLSRCLQRWYEWQVEP